MRGSVACLVKWGCQSFARWHEFKECGWTLDGESEEAKLKEKGRGGMRGEEKRKKKKRWKRGRRVEAGKHLKCDSGEEEEEGWLQLQ